MRCTSEGWPVRMSTLEVRSTLPEIQPSGKKECCSGLEVVWWEECLQAVSNCNVYPCHSEVLSFIFQVSLLASQHWNKVCSLSLLCHLFLGWRLIDLTLVPLVQMNWVGAGAGPVSMNDYLLFAVFSLLQSLVRPISALYSCEKKPWAAA